jgi:hypothetical protein
MLPSGEDFSPHNNADTVKVEANSLAVPWPNYRFNFWVYRNCYPTPSMFCATARFFARSAIAEWKFEFSCTYEADRNSKHASFRSQF